MQKTDLWCEKKFGYSFRDKILLKTALTHRSFSGENNERLEFLGDAVLDLVISEYLFQSFTGQTEGFLSRARSNLVKGDVLAKIAKELNVDQHLILGKGEISSGGRQRLSLLSNALEAIMGAVFLDGGYMVAKKIILKIFNSRIKNLNLDSEHKDHKSILQERLQEINKELPVYSLIRKDGKQHEQIFFVECLIKSEGIATQATGNSIRLAEQKAASKALKLMKNG